jgi:hypothetical protein
MPLAMYGVGEAVRQQLRLVRIMAGVRKNTSNEKAVLTRHVQQLLGLSGALVGF